ncbi:MULTISPECIES: PhoX family protein [unclassified Geodermatophilus]|uniref:PhoX family protein n=1 Tax=unclassified Geodermatophilus TaxID=2637632 RepID=UPI003EEA541B
MTLTSDPARPDAVDPDDLPSNPTSSTPLSDLVTARVSRRAVLTGGVLAAAGFLTTSLVAPPAAQAAPGRGAGRALLGFAPIGPSTDDVVHVPAGYTARVLIPWGTPITGAHPAFVPGTPGEPGGNASGNTAAQQAEQVGMHHDGMTYFPLESGRRGDERGLLVLNHEYTDEFYLHTGSYTAGYKPITAEGVHKSQAAHGVSVVEIERGRSGEWAPVRSARNRRITATSPMAFSGPAAGHPLLRTGADPQGSTPLGTINNCGNGETPWGTYLTCEENFNGYFRVDGPLAPADAARVSRYGVGGDRNGWAAHDPRFVLTAGDPNEPNRFGWVVEIDPFDPWSTPVKRTALGRLKHEDATVHVTRGGRVVVYMGDDQVFEYLYKFVSADNWRSMRARRRSPLDEGTLYVARFDADGRGTWIPLVHGQGPLTADNGFADQGAVLVDTRQAATLVGATPMDRPEWTAVDPRTGTAYLTLTNNTERTETDAANPRTANRWGHIIRWDEDGGDHAATGFTWDVFLLAGPGGGVEGSTIAAEDAFGSPDGLWLDPDSRAWIQTDGTQPGSANNQMLAADPTRTDVTGAPEVRRFLTGPKQCEITGIAMTPDQRTLFVNVQHPGENGQSAWPAEDGVATPRSATVVVTKDDGGVIGT